MIANLAFTLVAALLVYQAGRRDAARDPRLTIGLLVLMAAFPLFCAVLPKFGVLPSGSSAEAATGVPWASWIVGIWACGFLWQMGRLFFAALALETWKKHSIELFQAEGVSVRECDRIRSPVAAGIGTPVILVPTAWHEWPDDCRQMVISHELAHHKRRDPLWRLLAAITCAVHWYHPLVHWMSKRFIMQSEFACDAAVLRSGIRPQSYARVLCKVISGISPSPLAAAVAERSSLESRVRRMMEPRVVPARTASLAALSLLGLLTACSLAMLGPRRNDLRRVLQNEVELRLSANPFPGNP